MLSALFSSGLGGALAYGGVCGGWGVGRCQERGACYVRGLDVGVAPFVSARLALLWVWVMVVSWRVGLMGVTLGLGVLVWSQVCSGALEVEWTRSPLNLWMVLLYLLPLVGLMGGLVLRRGRWALVGLMGGLLPCFGVMPALDARALQVQGGALTLAVSVVAFVVAAGKLDAPVAEGATGEIGEAGEAVAGGVMAAGGVVVAVDARFWRLVRLALPRVLLSVALIVVPLWALYGGRGQAQLVENFAERPKDAAFLIHVVHLFVGSIAVYVSILSPSINRTLDAFELRERLRQERSAAAAKRRRRSLWVCAALLPLLSLVQWWFS